ncbi:hypothetical protein B7486_28625 [cyanobacterium TDX16]|nr:hypothetical protein B7486_28625 [cyanobacterium TDX16]
MSLYDETISKILQLPEPLVKEVSHFVDSLRLDKDNTRSALWMQSTEALKISTSDLSDYSKHPEEYEARLARGEIQQ